MKNRNYLESQQIRNMLNKLKQVSQNLLLNIFFIITNNKQNSLNLKQIVRTKILLYFHMINSNTPPAKRKRGRPKTHESSTFNRVIQQSAQYQTQQGLSLLDYPSDNKFEKVQQKFFTQNFDSHSQDMNYNINQQSQRGCLPYQMLPLSEVEDAQVEHQERTYNIGRTYKKDGEAFCPQKQNYNSIENDIIEHTPSIQQHHQNSLRKRIPKILQIQSRLEKQEQVKNGCRCKKSQCLKNYCECFMISLECNSNCQCLNCQNIKKQKKPHQRNSNKQKNKLKHEGRCSCKRSNCEKNYCECRQAGKACQKDCNCKDCKNKQQ